MCVCVCVSVSVCERVCGVYVGCVCGVYLCVCACEECVCALSRRVCVCMCEFVCECV